jgi:hypothetical protein
MTAASSSGLGVQPTDVGWTVSSLWRSRRGCIEGLGPGLGGLAAVPLEVKLALERVEYRLDGLAERFEQPRTGRFGFALAGRAQLRDSRIRQGGFGVGATHPMLVPNESPPVPCNGVGQLIPPSLLSARTDSGALGPGAHQCGPAPSVRGLSRALPRVGRSDQPCPASTNVMPCLSSSAPPTPHANPSLDWRVGKPGPVLPGFRCEQ